MQIYPVETAVVQMTMELSIGEQQQEAEAEAVEEVHVMRRAVTILPF